MIYLPLCNDSNAICTCFECLTLYFRLIPCFVGGGALSAFSVGELFFGNVVRFFGIF